MTQDRTRAARGAALLPALLLAAVAGLAPRSAAADPPAPPSIAYTHLWTDSHGATHQARCRLTRFALKSVNPPDTPEWVEMLGEAPKKIVFVVQPPGWSAPWHRNPAPQFIVPLSGHWSVTSTDGTKTVMGPGDISFGEDQRATAQPGGRTGHLSASVGDVPSVLMFAQLADPPRVDDPCPFR